jgi:recombination protein RecR
LRFTFHVLRITPHVFHPTFSERSPSSMPSLPQPILELLAALNKLPGIGPRSAERLALHLVQSDPAAVKQLADVLLAARARIRECPVCGALTEVTPCAICADDRRDAATVCVVEQAVDILSLEKSGTYRGKYHVLGGKISPLNGVGPEDLRISSLEARLGQEPIQEVILALGSDVEGDATSFYLSKRLAARGVKVTRIAHGLPAGSGLEFADELTLSRALEGRRELQ